MNFQKIKKFAVIAFSKETVRGVLFRINKESLDPLSCVSEKISEDDPSIAWKSVLRQMGRGRECPVYLTGALREGICFDTLTAELAPRFQKQALELELPRHLLSVPENARIQFLPQKKMDDGNLAFRVYAVLEKSFEPIAAMLTQGNSRADGFIYPALALQENDPPFFAPEMDPDRYFSDGKWLPGQPPQDFIKLWLEKLKAENLLKQENESALKDTLLHYIAARAILKHGDYSGLNILPDQLQPKRIRKQLKITVVLVILLLLNLVWSQSGDWKKSYQEMNSLEQQIKRTMRENAELKKKLKGKEKVQKEITRILNLNPGEKELKGRLADLSAALPSNILVTSIRWSESGVELQMQSSAAQSNISDAIRKLPYWKIGQLQQRRWGNSTSTMITLKLVPAEVKK